jgi:hypothetical protein
LGVLCVPAVAKGREVGQEEVHWCPAL